MTARRIKRRPGTRKAVVYAVLVHAALIALIVIGFRWQSKPAAPAPVIQAQAVNDAEMQKEVERRKREERERAAQEAKKKRDAEALERKAADDKRRQEQAKLAEQKRTDAAKRKAAEAAEKKRQDAQRQAEAEKKRKEEQRQAEARKKETEERRKAAETGLKEQLVREEQERTDAKAKAEQLARAQSERARFEGLIRQKVERNWVRPAGWTKDTECVVRVRLIPTGEVVQATVTRSSGSPAFDRSAENAVYKASPLPLPEDKALFENFRDFEFKFHPQERS